MLQYESSNGIYTCKNTSDRGQDADGVKFVYDLDRERLLHIKDGQVFTFVLSENDLVLLGDVVTEDPNAHMYVNGIPPTSIKEDRLLDTANRAFGITK
jgi:hypothetical protein